MLATFLHTGGLTGAEVGVAAATAFLNQKLLSALFGEAAMVELIQHARRRLQEVLAAAFAAERTRFDEQLPAPGELADLANELRGAAPGGSSAHGRRRMTATIDSPVRIGALEGKPPP